jgi:hypothetical protein
MRSHRPSPAIVLSALALFVALGGTALAARHYLITSASQIKPSVLAQLHGKAGAHGPEGTQGPTGPQGPAGTPGAPGTPATALWAQITSTGTLTASSGVIGILSGYPEAARVMVTFNRDVSRCGHIATLSTAAFGASEPGQITVSAAGNHDPDSLEVFTYNATGTSEFRSFSLAVFC